MLGPGALSRPPLPLGKVFRAAPTQLKTRTGPCHEAIVELDLQFVRHFSGKRLRNMDCRDARAPGYQFSS